MNKTYVIAYIDELDSWIKDKTRTKSNNKPFFLKYILSILFIAIAISVAFLILKSPQKSGDFSFKIEDTHLVITDKNGKSLWNYDLGPKLNQAEYRKEWAIKNILFEDIDNDGKPNVLMAIQNKNHFDEAIACLDHKGNLIWKYNVGREIQFGNKIISPDFDIVNFEIVDLDSDSRYETVITANHKIYFPSRVIILDSEGQSIGEYWNSGHFVSMAFTDLDDDQKKEIILGGVNNNYRKACIVVFDLLDVSGSSPQMQGTRYYSPELEPGSEKYYLLLPQNVVGQSMGIQENIRGIDLLNNGRFDVTTSISRIHYEFDRDLNCTDVYLGDEFVLNFNKLKQEGKLKIDLSDIDIEKLKSEISCWDGEGWISKVPVSDGS